MSSIKYTEEQAKSIENIQNTVFTKHPHICKKIVPLSILGIEPRVFFHWKEKGIVDIYTVAMFENVGSVYNSNYVGEYYNDSTEDLTFWWETDNNHWK